MPSKSVVGLFFVAKCLKMLLIPDSAKANFGVFAAADAAKALPTDSLKLT